ncbi:MAG: flagellar motor protein MotB [Rhodospirillales bacterium]|nr:flagellar motor protein MotB [Rhodospirillales bacterium]
MAQGPIIIKRVKKAAHGHHGGAWKVAYADFVTAMMAFFLLLWLLNAVTEEQLTGIADYFAPVTVSSSTSGSSGPLGGTTFSPTGAMVNTTSSPTVSQAIPPATISIEETTSPEPQEGMTEDQFLEAMADREQEQFEKARDALVKAVHSIPELSKMADSLLVDNTPEGLRIQIVDQEGLAMFPRGSSDMFGHTRAILDLVGRVINQLPQKIAISGHTDSTKFSQSNYTNWELSAERALATRRTLVGSGVPDARINRVVGKADQEPLAADDPTSPTNRRISIILLRENDLKPPPATTVGD